MKRSCSFKSKSTIYATSIINTSASPFIFASSDLPRKQSGDVNRLYQDSAPDDSEDMGKMIKDSNLASAPNAALTDPASLRKITDERYDHTNHLEPTKLAPIIVSTPAFEMRSDVTSSETHVMKLLEDLKSPQLEVVRKATSELRVLSKDMGNRIVIAGCGAISPLVNLLHSSDQTIQEYAVTTLLNLSINDNNKIAIAKADAIEPLIHVLRTGSPEARENSAAALSSLSVFEDNNILIGNSGAITPLVELLGNGTPLGKRDAAKALFNLSTCNENRLEIVKSGAVKSLIELMDPATGMVDKATVVLANLASIPEGRTAIAEADGIPPLVEAIELGSMRVKEIATQALVRLCSDSNRCCRKVLEEGAIPPLMVMSKSGIRKAPERADKLLRLLRNQQGVYAKRG